jgi:phytol kinase
VYQRLLGVDRLSFGEFHYTIAVAVVFALAHRAFPLEQYARVVYVTSILVLAVADAVAALVGSRYGKVRYLRLKATKTLEGSVAFFVASFLATHLPLLLFTGTPPWQSVLIGLTVALVVTLLEAGAWRGLDNLLIPVGTCLILQSSAGRPVRELALLLGLTTVLFVFMVVFRRRTNLRDSAVVAGMGIAFFCFYLAGWVWLVAPLTTFVSYTFLWPSTRMTRRRKQDMSAVIGVTSVGLLWLLAQLEWAPVDFLYPYTVAFACHLAMIGLARLSHARPLIPAWGSIGIATAKSWVLLFGPYALIRADDPNLLVQGLLAPIWIGMALLAFVVIQPNLERFPIDVGRWVRQAICALVASAIGFALTPP